MIELNNKSQHDFLNREWVQKLLDAGVDMSDAKYSIQVLDEKDCVIYIDNWKDSYSEINMLPTYTISELLYKLHEWIAPTINGKEFSGGLRFFKDAPFYVFYYGLKHKESDTVTLTNSDYICSELNNPIESLASVLLQCHQKDIGLKRRDTGNIQDKYNQ